MTHRSEWHCDDEAQTQALAARLAGVVDAGAAPVIVWLRGALGAGKTTFARGFLRALGERGTVRSPTFTLLETYACAGLDVVHLDLYRIDQPATIEGLGLRDYDRAGTLWLIEWAEKGGRHVPAPDLVVTLESSDPAGRQVTLEAGSATGRAILSALDTSDSCRSG